MKLSICPSYTGFINFKKCIKCKWENKYLPGTTPDNYKKIKGVY